MKKLFALLLAATMLLCTVPFVVSADTAEPSFTPVSSLADFYWVTGDGTTESPYALTNALGGENNYKLTADITFGNETKVALQRVVKNTETEEYEPMLDATTQQPLTYEWTFADLARGMIDGGFEGIFDGDGHSIIYTGNFKKESSGGFLFNGSFLGTLKNLTVGSKEQPTQVLLGKPSGGSNCGVIGSQTGYADPLPSLENVVVYADLEVQGQGSRNAGFLFGKTLAGISFNNVRCYGTLEIGQTKDGQVMGIGGMVGMHVCNAGDGAPIYFNNCYTDVDITAPAMVEGSLKAKEGSSGVGGLVGVNNCKNADTEFYATNCVTVGDLPTIEGLTVGAGKLLGNVVSNADKTAEELTILTDCQKPIMNAVGASIKIADGTLRFRVSVAVYNAYVDLYGADNVKVGVIYAEKATAETLGANFKIDPLNNDITNVVVAELDNGNIYADVAATANSYGTEYTALGYIQYTTDGTTWTTEYAEASTTRSVSAVATAALADVADVQGNGYGYATADGKYCFYTAEQQTKLASYIVASAS